MAIQFYPKHSIRQEVIFYSLEHLSYFESWTIFFKRGVPVSLTEIVADYRCEAGSSRLE